MNECMSDCEYVVWKRDDTRVIMVFAEVDGDVVSISDTVDLGEVTE